MALVWKDKVAEISTTTGTGALTLSGALTGYRTFASVCSTSDTVYYSITAVDGNGNPTGDWETGLGTYSATNTLTRTTVLDSSNAGSAVNFGAGTKRVVLSQVAAVAGVWEELTLTNPGAETGDTTGWTQSGGGFTAGGVDPAPHVATPIKGSYAFYASANAAPSMYQDVSLSAYSTQIAAGNLEFMVTAFGAFTFTDRDHIELRAEFRTSGGSQIAACSSWDGTSEATLGQGFWYNIRLIGVVPATTNTVRLNVIARRLAGTNNNAAVDDIRVFVRKFV